MQRITQTCGWCKQVVEHGVMGNSLVSTGIHDEERCSSCQALLLPFQTPDGIARVQKAGAPELQVGEPVWAASAKR